MNATAYHFHGHETAFCDEFNEEHSRDVEPIKGGYKDAYYLQTVAFARRFKGMEPPAVDDAHYTIAIDGDFSEWKKSGGTYKEYVGDCAHRGRMNYVYYFKR